MSKKILGSNGEHLALSRRDLLVGASALGLAAGGLGTLALPAKAAEPKKGGTLRYGCAHGSTTDNLDPATYENDFMIGMSLAFMNFLTEIGTDGNLQPELAESLGGFGRRQDLDLQAAQRRPVPQRQGNDRRGCDCLLQSSSRRGVQLGSEANRRADCRHHRRRYPHGDLLLEGRRRGFPLHRQRLSHWHHALGRRQDRSEQGHRHRSLRHSGVRSRRSGAALQESQLLQERSRSLRRDSLPLDYRPGGTHQRDDHRRGRHHQPPRI